MKKAFSLIEVLISIILFGMVYLTITNILSYLKTSNSFLKELYYKFDKNEKILKTLYMDLLEAYNVKIVKKDKNTCTLYIKTNNSLYNLSQVYVIWYVNKGRLIRVESLDKRLLPLDKIGYMYDFGEVKIFRVFRNKNRFFVFYKNDKSFYFNFEGKS